MEQINTSTRIELSDSVMDMAIKLSEGNPGALTCIMDCLKKDDWYANTPAFMYVIQFDSIGVYGSQLYMLWNDCCDRDLTKLELVLRNWQMGHLSRETILNNVSQGRGTAFEGLKTLEELFGNER